MPPQKSSTNEDIRHEKQLLLHQMDQMATIEPLRRPSRMRRESFLQEFVQADGPSQIVFLILLLALGFGSTIGVVPAVMTDRYARLNHGYSGNLDCADYTLQDKPQACLDGSADAQGAVAMEQMISNMLTFMTSSLMGSISDERGRKGILLLGIFLSSLSPLCLVLLQLSPSMSPIWYYGAGAFSGLVSWVSIALSSLSDVMPPKWRAPSFGLLLAGFSLGFAMAPQLALILGHWKVSVMALINVWIGILIVILFFPETLPPGTADHARSVRQEMTRGMTGLQKSMWSLYRPIWELSILNRNTLFRLLSLLAFFSGAVSAGDRTLLLYYLEERLSFDDKDVAMMFGIMGLLGIFVQAFVLRILNDAIGERRVVILAFFLGVIHNILYGIAKDKATVFISIAISAFVGMSFPTISAIKANNVEESEQGRIQGALYSIQALASATGPMCMRAIYGWTRNGSFLGPGSMFICASGFYAIAVYCAYRLPPEADSNRGPKPGQPDERTCHEEEETLL